MSEISNKRIFQIAIDGPVAAGKGSVSKLLAKRLGWLYVDTGATYRVATLLALRQGVDLGDEQKIADLVKGVSLDMEPLEKAGKGGSLVKVIVNGEDVTEAIRTKEIDERVHMVAALAGVRSELVKKQQEIAGRKNVVMEGRDITYRVLPEAQVRIYLDASEDVRVRRRVEQLRSQGMEASVEGVAKRIRERDELDKNRETDPLQIVPGVWHLDTTGMGIEEVVEKIVERVETIQASNY